MAHYYIDDNVALNKGPSKSIVPTESIAPKSKVSLWMHMEVSRISKWFYVLEGFLDLPIELYKYFVGKCRS